MTKRFLEWLSLAVALVLLPATVMAQSVATGTISGVVRDASGAVLPGVTVEAASPALIEKVRTVVTDEQGLYRIIDLRPGSYAVTFSLTGFNALRREGIELTTGFTATVNAELAIGDLLETITVSGAAPMVDTQNSSQQRVFAREITESLPVGSTVKLYATLIPGVVYNGGAGQQDVGGSKSEFQQGFSIHGGRANDFQQLRDGMFFGTLIAAGNWMTSLNPATVAEVTVQTSSASAELESGGALINVVPRDGGNSFRGTFTANGSARSLQSDNLDDELRARGVTSAPFLRKRYDVGGGVGGPLQEDKLWFFLSLRSWRTSSFYPGNYFNATPSTLFYTPDLTRPAFEDSVYREARVRTTWQASRKDKVVAMFGNEWNCNCPGLPAGFRSPETFIGSRYRPNWQAQVSWSRPATDRLLLEAGTVVVNGRLNLVPYAPDDAGPFVLDTSRGLGYGNVGYALGLMGAEGYQEFGQANQRFAVSYVTGSHSFRAGVQLMHGWRNLSLFMDPAVNYTSYVFNDVVPTAVNYYAGPTADKGRQRNIGAFVQDQWTVHRLTLNMGLRFDYLNGRVPAVDLPAGTWVPERSFPEVKNVPNWKDWNPRLGAAYDLFGNGKTAIKGFVGRYILFELMGGIIAQNSPANLISTTANRAWTDGNGDYVPQESELGPLSNVNFGRTVRTTTYADDVLTDNRQYNWQGSLQLQQELWPGTALSVGYFRTWHGNFRVVDNQAVAAQDFNPYCITSPSNAGLPGGGGNPICGFYDVVPEEFGQSNNVITLAKNYGNQTEVFNGIDVTMSARFGRGAYVQGGVAMGATVTDNCFQNDQPNIVALGTAAAAPTTLTSRTSEYCHVSPPWSGGTQFKVAVVYPLWWGLQASANYQNLAGIPTAATTVVSNAAIVPSLGRSLSACGGRVPCTSTVTADVVLPNTYYQEPRSHQLDLRFSRTFQLPRGARIQPQVDIFNVTNSNSVLGINTALGPAWRNATAVLEPRVLRFGVNMNF